MKNSTEDKLIDFGAKSFIIGMVLLFAYSVTVGFSWMRHASQTANLSQMNASIAIHQTEYDKASALLTNLNEGGTAFRLNADTPVASLVDAQVRLAKALVDVKVYRLEYIADISSRCRGPWAITVRLFDDITCATYKAM